MTTWKTAAVGVEAFGSWSRGVVGGGGGVLLLKEETKIGRSWNQDLS